MDASKIKTKKSSMTSYVYNKWKIIYSLGKLKGYISVLITKIVIPQTIRKRIFLNMGN